MREGPHEGEMGRGLSKDTFQKVRPISFGFVGLFVFSWRDSGQWS